MAGFIKKYRKQLFYLSWFILNLIQAYTTELFDDEAYYWVYSNFPAWGYFDHPPMIAIIIKAGYALFQNELGVRFIIVCLSTATLVIAERLTEKKNDILFFAICSSIALAQIGGIIAVPDIPLLFFVGLFFLLYRRFVERMNFSNTCLLGISVALMLYCKYHGLLVVLFTFISNPKLFLKYQSYLVALISLLLFSPHLYWQYVHNFPSVQYHLFERSSEQFKISFTLEYIFGQLLLTGPLVGWFLLWSAFRHKPMSFTQRALKFTFCGLYIFFLLASLKGRVEANWTAPAFIGLIILSHQHVIERNSRRQWLYKTVPFTLLIVATARIYMMLDLSHMKQIPTSEFQGNRKWVKELREKAGDKPLVVINSYQKASKAWFYSGIESFSLNTGHYRRNNYNFWPIEDSLLNNEVYMLGPYDSSYFAETFNVPRLKNNGGKDMQHFYSLSKILFTNVKEKSFNKDRLTVSLMISTPSHYLPLLQTKLFDTAKIYLGVYKNNQFLQYIASDYLAKEIVHENSTASIIFPIDLSIGKYVGKLAISSAVPGQPSLNSSKFIFRVRSQ